MHLPKRVLKLAFCLLVVTPFWSYQYSNAQSLPDKGEWMKKEWNGPDQPFQNLRIQIEKNFVTKPKTQWPDFVVRLKSELAKSPQSKAALFKWAYASFLYSAETGKTDPQSFLEIQTKLSENFSPGSYQFGRLRFLIEARQFASPRLLPVGQRLWARDNRDYDVGYLLIDMLNLRDASQKSQAIRVAHQLVKIAPNRSSAHASLGWVHFRIWLGTHDPQQAKTSITAYQRYLQLAPSNDPFRKRATALIAEMQKR